MNNMNIIKGWDFFYSNVSQTIDKCIPVSQCKKKATLFGWIVIEEKYNTWKHYTYSCNREDNIKYRKIRNKLPKCVNY